MRELMLKLLTYEPFNKIKGDEKKYIDAVLRKDYATSKSYPLYDELMVAFEEYSDLKKQEDLKYQKQVEKIKNSKKLKKSEKEERIQKIGKIEYDRTKLIQWFKKYYTLSSAGNIGKVCYRSSGNRTYYPVLFKKICVCCILDMQLANNTRDNASNAKFFDDFGMRENILNKWHVSTRYMFLANQDTYSAFRLYRNGLKKPYLTRIIKKVYYESANQLRQYADTAKKYELETFVDVFSGTGTVAASVNANNVIVNDIDAGASCFLFAFVNYEREVKKVLADFHKQFVSENLCGKELYSEEELEYHFVNYARSNVHNISKSLDITQMYDEEYYDQFRYNLSDDEIELGKQNVGIHRKFIKDIRNNYKAMESALDDWNTKYNAFDLSKLPTDIDFSKNPNTFISKIVEDIIEYGVMWFFFWSIRKNNSGRKPFVTDMSEKSYSDYILNVLGFDYSDTKDYKDYSESGIDAFYVAKYFVEHMNLCEKDITFDFDNTHNFFKYMENAKVYNLSYKLLFCLLDDLEEACFYYLDSPYFLTTDYEIPFQDKEHKKMLKILRNASFHWLFSMQYYEGATNKVKSVARPSLKEYHPQIRDYDAYYKGFIREFTENESGYWVVEDGLDDDMLDKLFVILFEDTSSNEIMICNFDVRPAIKYGEDAAVLPMRDFLGLEKQKGMKYATIYHHAVEWRQKQIEKNYYSGDWV